MVFSKQVNLLLLIPAKTVLLYKTHTSQNPPPKVLGEKLPGCWPPQGGGGGGGWQIPGGGEGGGEGTVIYYLIYYIVFIKYLTFF